MRFEEETLQDYSKAAKHFKCDRTSISRPDYMTAGWHTPHCESGTSALLTAVVQLGILQNSVLLIVALHIGAYQM